MESGHWIRCFQEDCWRERESDSAEGTRCLRTDPFVAVHDHLLGNRRTKCRTLLGLVNVRNSSWWLFSKEIFERLVTLSLAHEIQATLLLVSPFLLFF